MAASQQIALRHFGRKTVVALARKGIRIVSLQALPDEQGSYLNSTTGYVVDDNGCGRIWTYFEIARAAR